MPITYNFKLEKIKNFNATPEQLMEQIEYLFRTGQIDERQYEWGKKGVKLLPEMLKKSESKLEF